MPGPTLSTIMPTVSRHYRPSAQRRRDALLRAAVELVGEAGTGAVTHRAVAARAGVPPATTSYFFTSITELLAEALRSFGAARADEINTLAEELTAAVAPPAEMADRFAAALLGGDRAEELAEIECHLHASRSSELQDAVADLAAAYENMAVVVLRAVGMADPERAAPAFKALVDGFVLAHLAHPRPDDQERLAQAIRALLIGYTR